MPTYEYECKSCGYTFDKFQNMSEEPVKACPECGQEVRRLIRGGTGLIFKGSGFYITDKNAKAPKSESKGTDSSTSAPSSTESSSGGTGRQSSGASVSAAGESAAPAASTTEKKPVKT
ncbi:MAG: zinc ribbon domain-containing protein [Treponema sp.]|jgi:putative FmdB family regulatory protein|nr:zinc ribbon domain-containing protein [Treponema sp.]